MDTIVALATAQGKAGIAVLRVSGNDALSICDKIIKFKKKSLNICNCKPNTVYYCDIVNSNTGDAYSRIIDDGLVTVFLSPHSYTGENTVEISCHGSRYIVHEIMELLVKNGARPAEAGEYTKRAFLNGKITLTGAEAIGRLIESSNRHAATLAFAQSKGKLSQKISEIYDKISNLVSETYVYIDYPDEDLSDVTAEEMSEKLKEIKSETEKLKNSYNTGRIINNGILCTIMGKTNVGKSTLINLLANDDIAIVTDIPGTTRDVLETVVNIGGFTFKIFDTAGIRSTDNVIESVGIEKAYKKAEISDLIIAVFDLSEKFDEDDENIIKYISLLHSQNKKILIVYNKYDKNKNKFNAVLSNKFLQQCEKVFISARDNKSDVENVTATDAVEAAIRRIFDVDEELLSSGEILAEERQYLALTAAVEMISSALTALESGFSQDVAGLDLEHALTALASCDSREVSEDIAEKIFHNFCVGK